MLLNFHHREAPEAQPAFTLENVLTLRRRLLVLRMGEKQLKE